MNQRHFEVTPIGRVESPLTDPAAAPKQGDEGAPDAWLVFEPAVLQALDSIRAGDEVIVLPGSIVRAATSCGCIRAATCREHSYQKPVPAPPK